ncbi:hypothetical protein AWH56_025635 [Anaerobacillus isosaccharinicus]|uniref:Uncharacterized protein n=1 Tax=Anaerobacillus isosaccharinicus TaxID=1532552 RepID=A0A1S2KV40_9BACI|nr:hypothetical protein [Anaerobacillus isosaccharinicus]MBA5585707.1 hypothetical protein [Anaerobacillus isosaccharinicus]QOY35987.1 hypothetical protein AWH56_025635 [Anaerobacillus isosaccharinicus]
MKKVFIYIFSFFIVFIATYLIIGYLPNFRIKLHAPSMEYFVESLKHMVFFKSLVSVSVGLLVSGLLFIIKRRTNENAMNLP